MYNKPFVQSITPLWKDILALTRSCIMLTQCLHRTFKNCLFEPSLKSINFSSTGYLFHKKRIRHKGLLYFHKTFSFLFLQCEAVFAFQGVFTKVSSTFTNVCPDIKLTILPSFFVFLNLFLAGWASDHKRFPSFHLSF